VLLGFVFLWAFLDKAFGVGFATPADGAWTAGGSPTEGFLASVDGAFAGMFQAMAGQAWVDWLFMLGMLLVGGALVLGIAMRLAAMGATLLMGSLWLASLPLENNPVVDEHVVYAATAITLALTQAGHTLGLGSRWASLRLFPGWRWLA
jgi:thiosulfate dehydrogenase [quinone] large subunit